MRYKKALIASVAVVILATTGVGLAATHSTSRDTPKNAEIPLTFKEQTVKTKSDTPETPSDTTTPVTPQPTDNPTSDPVETAPAGPTVYFSASSDQYPGSGTFDFPYFQTTNKEWSANFSYSCETGKVFALANDKLFITDVLGNIMGTQGKLKVIVPAEATNCIWSVSATS